MRSISGHKNDDYLTCEKLKGISLNMFHGNICRIKKKKINTIESVSYNFLEVFIACVLKIIDKNSFNKRDIN